MFPVLLAAAMTVVDINQIAPDTLSQQEAVVRFSKGTKLPVELFLGGNVCSIEGNQFHVNKTFFIKVEDEELYFSWDGEEWLTFLEAFTGTIKTEIHADGKVKLILGGELNKR